MVAQESTARKDEEITVLPGRGSCEHLHPAAADVKHVIDYIFCPFIATDYPGIPMR